MIIRTYSEMLSLPTFEERFEYLRMDADVGVATFGHSRYINQSFYTSPIWRTVRHEVILRDNGCDLAIPDREIYGKIVVHHMNSVTEEDIVNHSDFLLNPEYLVCVCLDTHNAVHFGDETLLPRLPIERVENDTAPWRLQPRRNR